MDMEKKPGLAIVIASKMKGKPDEEEKEGENKYTEMASEILEAIKSEDSEALGKALQNFVKVCSAEE